MDTGDKVEITEEVVGYYEKWCGARERVVVPKGVGIFKRERGIGELREAEIDVGSKYWLWVPYSKVRALGKSPMLLKFGGDCDLIE